MHHRSFARAPLRRSLRPRRSRPKVPPPWHQRAARTRHSPQCLQPAVRFHHHPVLVLVRRCLQPVAQFLHHPVVDLVLDQPDRAHARDLALAPVAPVRVPVLADVPSVAVHVPVAAPPVVALVAVPVRVLPPVVLDAAALVVAVLVDPVDRSASPRLAVVPRSKTSSPPRSRRTCRARHQYQLVKSSWSVVRPPRTSVPS